MFEEDRVSNYGTRKVVLINIFGSLRFNVRYTAKPPSEKSILDLQSYTHFSSTMNIIYPQIASQSAPMLTVFLFQILLLSPLMASSTPNPHESPQD